MKKLVVLAFFITTLAALSNAQLLWQENLQVKDYNFYDCPDTSNNHHTLKLEIVDGIYSTGCQDPIVVGYIFVDAAPEEPFQLFPNAPNPFSIETEFRFYLPEENFVEIAIFTIFRANYWMYCPLICSIKEATACHTEIIIFRPAVTFIG